MKFKVGDKVRVTNAVTDHNRARDVGRTLTVTQVNFCGLDCHYRKGVNYYAFDHNETPYIFYEDELELVEDKFTKSDLKDGMVVEYRDASRRMVLGDRLLGFDGNNNLGNYNDNLTDNDSCDALTIDKVYKSKCLHLNDYFNDKYLTLIWERPKSAKKMTVEEIEKVLGHKVEIVSDSNN